MRLHSNGGKSSLEINIIYCIYPSYLMLESGKAMEIEKMQSKGDVEQQ